MKIALTLEKETNQIFQHFGKTSFFYIYDTKTSEGKIIDNAGFSHQDLIGYLKSNEIEVLICGGIGSHAIDLLDGANIKVYPGQTGNVLDVIKKYNSGKIVSNFKAIHNCSNH